MRTFVRFGRQMAGMTVALLVASLPMGASHMGAHAEYVGGTRADIPTSNTGSIEVMDNTYLSLIHIFRGEAGFAFGFTGSVRGGTAFFAGHQIGRFHFVCFLFRALKKPAAEGKLWRT